MWARVGEGSEQIGRNEPFSHPAIVWSTDRSLLQACRGPVSAQDARAEHTAGVSPLGAVVGWASCILAGVCLWFSSAAFTCPSAADMGRRAREHSSGLSAEVELEAK